MNILPYFSPERLLKLVETSNMVKTLNQVESVFKRPEIRFTEVPYKGLGKYIKIFGKQVKIPTFLTFDKTSEDVNYWYALGECHIRRFPYGKFTFFGKTIVATFYIPTTNTTNEINYWTSILTYLNAEHGVRENLPKVIEHLGKESWGVVYNGGEDETSLKYTVNSLSKEVLKVPSKNPIVPKCHNNSLYFVLDESYLQPEHLELYFDTCKRYNKEESPLLI